MNPDQALSSALQALEPSSHLYIAFSGGLDSTVLLQSLVAYLRTKSNRLTALHINHGLSENADQWQAECAAICERLGVELRVHRIDLGGPGSANLEQRAREARYQWFSSLLSDGDRLLTGHHLDDQAETLILRLMRASGSRGLAAIPSSRPLGKGRVLRPFLNLPKSILKCYAQSQGLTWVEDDSNLSLEFDRNYIRHQILPALTERWPAAVRQIARSAMYCREDQHLLEELAAVDLAAVEVTADDSVLAMSPALDLGAFSCLSNARQRHLLQSRLRHLTGHSIPSSRMYEWLRQIRDYRQGGQQRLEMQDVLLAVYDQKMHFLRNVPDLSGMEIDWNPEQPLDIAALGARLSMNHDLYGTLPKADEISAVLASGETLRVHWRRGGERVQMKGEPHSRSLKKLLQQKKVAPWLRAVLPLVSCRGNIIWSASLGDFMPDMQDFDGNRLKINIEKIK